MSSSIIRKIADEIRPSPVLQNSIIMDATRDVSGVGRRRCAYVMLTLICWCTKTSWGCMKQLLQQVKTLPGSFWTFCSGWICQYWASEVRHMMELRIWWESGLLSASTATNTIYTLWSAPCHFSYTTSLHSVLCCAKCTWLDTWPWHIFGAVW